MKDNSSKSIFFYVDSTFSLDFRLFNIQLILTYDLLKIKYNLDLQFTEMKIVTLLLAGLASSTLFGQYCTGGVGPTSNADSNVEFVQLNGVVGSINYNGCPGVLGLQDLTASQSTTLNAGDSYSVTVRYGTCSATFYSGAGTVWIDFNANEVFESSEIIGTWQGSAETQLVYNFTVPAGAQNGFTRMRVIQQEQASLPLNPCAQFTWGSAADFGITIGNGIDCTGYVGDDTADPVIVSSLPYTATGDNSYCYANDNPVYGSPDVYYRLNPSPLMQSISVSLCGSTFDTFLSVIDAMGNVIAFNDDAEGCVTSSALSFETEGLGQVYVIVEGWGNEMGDYEIAINANYLETEEIDPVAFSIFPNPANNEFFLSGFEGRVNLVDLSGKLVHQFDNVVGRSNKLNGLVGGVYFVHFEKDGQIYQEKLIVK